MHSIRHRDSLLLRALFAAEGVPLARDTLAGAAGLAPSQLEEALAPYAEAGYPIEFHPHGGISLAEPPDIWCGEEILGRCPPQPGLPAWDPLLLRETTSTNDVAREQGRRGAAAGFVVAASHQTRGRGRLSRSWESPPDCGLYVSILLRPTLTTARAGELTILSSVAAADAVEKISGLRPQIKWPNDLVVNGRKLAGLLIETEPRRRELAFAVIGLGLNVRHRAGDFSEELRTRATSLYLATGCLYRRADLLVALLHALENRLRAPFAQTRETWVASSLTLGQRVILSTLRGAKEGQALGLDDSGALLLRRDTGEIEAVTAGDMQAV